jgi:hypothetical protein
VPLALHRIDALSWPEGDEGPDAVKRVQLEKLTARRLGELSASRDAGCRKMRRGVDGFNSGLRGGAQAGRRFVVK